MKKRKWVKPLIIVIICIIFVPLVISLSYVGYVVFSYHRIGDKELSVTHKSNNIAVELNKDLTFTTYNIGFGAYSDNYSFFMDKGYDENGNPTQGKYGKAISKEDVLKNINGSIKIVKELNSDFYAFQEVDENSDRAYHVNQKEMLINEFNNF